MLVLTLASGPSPTAEAQGSEEWRAPALSLEEVATGLVSPTTITNADDGSGRLFVLEQPGRIRIVDGNGELLAEPFLDLTGSISSGGERGLLGLAFPPDFEENGLFYVNYTDEAGDTVVARYSVTGQDGNRADPGSATTILTVEQPYANHNGGGLAFGPDGYLYISLGDGGSAGDPHDNGQDTGTLLGSLLRIDVDTGDPYGIPADNPFADGDGGQPEIWAYGLRNPWRFSFDRETGQLWIADVGQNMWEEINRQPPDSGGGENYGWRLMEGTHCFEPRQGCERDDLVLPVLEYSHDHGCSVTGGHVYRGEAISELAGTYLYGDYCSGIVWGARGSGDDWSALELLDTGFMISAFGEDEAGEVYVADHQGGTIYRIVQDR